MVRKSRGTNTLRSLTGANRSETRTPLIEVCLMIKVEYGPFFENHAQFAIRNVYLKEKGHFEVDDVD